MMAVADCTPTGPTTRLTIPAETLPAVRAGLYSLLADALEALARATIESPTPARPTGALANLDRVRDALDTIGWETHDRAGNITISLPRHRWAILEALHAILAKAELAQDGDDTNPAGMVDALRSQIDQIEGAG